MTLLRETATVKVQLNEGVFTLCFSQFGAVIGNFAQYYTDTTYSSSYTGGPTDATAAAVIGVIIIGVIIGLLLYGIPALISTWQLFKKAGRPGWAAIVPVYNSMTMADIAGKPQWMGILLGGLPILGSIVTNINEKLAPLSSLFSLAGVVLYIIVLVALVKQYKSNTAFWVKPISYSPLWRYSWLKIWNT